MEDEQKCEPPSVPQEKKIWTTPAVILSELGGTSANVLPGPEIIVYIS